MEELEKDFIKSEFDNMILNSSGGDKMHMRLSEDELLCMHTKAKSILDIKNDFKIGSKAFKEMKLEFEYLHFVFVDINSLQGVSSAMDYGHDLYYLIINTNRFFLRSSDFDVYKAYCVYNEAIKVFDIDGNKFLSYKDFFNENVGRNIRSNSASSKITEYITFEKDKVKDFKEKLADDGDMNVKLICIDKNCLSQGSTITIQEYLNNLNNQGKLSLAFQQKNDPDKPNSDFFDIGNMQP